jgi:hypothetical protein
MYPPIGTPPFFALTIAFFTQISVNVLKARNKKEIIEMGAKYSNNM